VQFANSKEAELPILLDARLEEIRAELERQQSIAKANRWISRVLIVGQYIIGGLLASAFVQKSLSHELVGALGLFVLFSSLIYQRFRPDVQLRGAMSRSLRLKATIRQAEDDICAIQAGAPDAPSVLELRRKLSSALSEIELSEWSDVTTGTDESREMGKLVQRSVSNSPSSEQVK
jgi:hypothetical protein